MENDKSLNLPSYTLNFSIFLIVYYNNITQLSHLKAQPWKAYEGILGIK